MPNMTGLEWLNLSKPNAQIIITSAYGEFALESYELDVCDYLLKPFSFSRFIKAIKKAQEHIHLQPNLSSKNKSIMIKVDKKYFKVDPTEITYLESFGNYVKIHIGKRKLVTHRTMASLVSELDPNDFIQIHKSYYINKYHLHSVEGNLITLKSKDELKLSRQYKSSFMSRLNN